MNQGNLSSNAPAFVQVNQQGVDFYTEHGKLPYENFNPVLEFVQDADSYFDATGQTISISLGGRLINGVAKIVRLNKPTAVNFTSSFEASPSSTAFSSTNLNVISFIYFANWGGLNVPKVIYTNVTYTAI